MRAQKNEKVRPGRKTNGFGKALYAGQYNQSREANYNFQIWFQLRAENLYRVLKPGAYVGSFGSPRTFHRMVTAFEDAGFEIRDTLMWVFSSGFPKSKDLEDYGYPGMGTAVKPCYEPILIARKPISEKNIQSNMKLHGTGGINIDGCRVPYESQADFESATFGSQPDIRGGNYKPGTGPKEKIAEDVEGNPNGRWPGNLIHDGSEDVVKLFPMSRGQSGAVSGAEPSSSTNNVYGKFNGRPATQPRGDFHGSAARFFYCPKIAPEDRNEGLPEGMINTHPTVKPTALMRWLVRLLTPIGGTCIDIFSGSGSTGKACAYELVNYVGIDEQENNLPIAEHRIRFAIKNRSGQFPIFDNH